MFTRVNSKCAHQVRPPLGWIEASGRWRISWRLRDESVRDQA